MEKEQQLTHMQFIDYTDIVYDIKIIITSKKKNMYMNVSIWEN